MVIVFSWVLFLSSVFAVVSFPGTPYQLQVQQGGAATAVYEQGQSPANVFGKAGMYPYTKEQCRHFSVHEI